MAKPPFRSLRALKIGDNFVWRRAGYAAATVARAGWFEQAAAVGASIAATEGADVLAAAVEPVSSGVNASSATTNGADILAANVAPVVGASSAKTDGADVLVANVAPVVGVSAAKTDGADALAASVSVVVAASSATTDGADVVAASAAPIVAASSASADGADVLAALVDSALASVSASSATTDGADALAAEVAPGSAQRAPAGHGTTQARRVAIEAHGRILTFETEEEAEAWLAAQDPKQAKVIRKIARRVAQASGQNLLGAAKATEYVAPQLLHGSPELRALVEMRAALLKAKFTDETLMASNAKAAMDEEEGMMAAMLMMALN